MPYVLGKSFKIIVRAKKNQASVRVALSLYTLADVSKKPITSTNVNLLSPLFQGSSVAAAVAKRNHNGYTK